MLIHYNPKLKQLARNLRNNSSISEIRFWNQVKGKQMKGYQFLRQKPIGNYIVDFFCSKLHLVIEIDGESHLGQEKADMKKQHYLESIGLITQVLLTICLFLKTSLMPSLPYRMDLFSCGGLPLLLQYLS